MEEFLLGIERDPVIDDPEIASFWEGLPQNLEKLENVIWAENPAKEGDFGWTMGGDGISRVWHPGVNEEENWGWAGAPDIVAEYKGKIVLGDLKTSNGPYYSKWPGPETPKNQYGMRRAGFMKYQKCQLQLAAYALGLEHTVNIKPEICMTFVATRETVQVFAIQAGTIEKYKQKENAQIARLFTVKDPLVNIIYICPFPLTSEIYNYYLKILELVEIEHPEKRFTIVVPENYTKFHEHLSLTQALLYSPLALG